MKDVLRQLFLGAVLIVLASAVLLLSDLDSRSHVRANIAARSRLPHVALVQHNTNPVFDAGVNGIVFGLEESGFIHGETINLRKLNPFGDSNLANAIAREVTEGGYDLVITVTTPSLLSVANANRNSRVPHLFALVADPVATKTGILSLDSLEHPPYMTGYGTRLPASTGIRVAKEINPRLQVVGTIWNTTEINSEVQIRDARETCAELGIRLLEANVDTTSAVMEAANSLISRGIEILFIPGDITVMSAIDNAIGVANRAGIPSYVLFPAEVEKGNLFGVGADYYEVGRKTGHMAAEVLRGRSTAEIPVTNYVPERIVLNEKIRRTLREPEKWRFPPELVARSWGIYEADGRLNQLRPDPQAHDGNSEEQK